MGSFCFSLNGMEGGVWDVVPLTAGSHRRGAVGIGGGVLDGGA